MDFNINALAFLFQYLFIKSDQTEDNSRLPTNSDVPNGNGNNMRTALLGSISGFNKGKLKKCETNDKSEPKI